MLKKNNNRWLDVCVRVASYAFVSVLLEDIELPNPFDSGGNPPAVEDLDTDIFDSGIDSSPDYQSTYQETNTRFVKVTEDHKNV